MRLIKDMYRDTLLQAGLFGLRKDQMRGPILVQNAGWYNQRGEYLGHGDLGHKDLDRILNDIGEDEAFVIFAEETWRSSFTVKRNGGPSGKEFYKELGTEYAIRHCAAIVTPYGVFVAKGTLPLALSDLSGNRTYQVPRSHLGAILNAFCEG